MEAEFMVEVLKRRAEIVRTVRAFFDSRDFTEVETAVAIAAPAPEEHIDCPPLARPLAAGGPVPFLRASPELQMKKLLAAGMDRIYQLGPCFREGECGARHRPEFTMLEWYRRGAGYLDIARDLEDLLRGFPAFAGAGFRRLTVREAYRVHAGWDPWAGWDADRFDFDMAAKVEPALREEEGVFLLDYPPAAASLAKLRGEVAERWEFYWRGIELANCFTELCDGEEQRRRFEKAKAARRELGETEYPLDGEFLAAIPAIGSAAGVALGVDRLVMAVTGVGDIGGVRAGGI